MNLESKCQKTKFHFDFLLMLFISLQNFRYRNLLSRDYLYTKCNYTFAKKKRKSDFMVKRPDLKYVAKKQFLTRIKRIMGMKKGLPSIFRSFFGVFGREKHIL